ncbi:helix-turn-helix transcriptional regulator [Methylobacter psychrophilus]|uniref:helix-turn-helix transcriptional regulator n=1 Tax=Methylobacter psychrophilus TaxID=96941 RepID=UPI0021D489E3|nr:WYL domain-containing protein [Methylobacter psychrophilus]
MANNHHDTLVYRLVQMLVKLNQGEKLEPRALAEEFGVNMRTIQRDLNQRFAYLPLEKIDGRYQLDPTFLGKISIKDIQRFASLAGVKGLFPSLGNDFLRDIFDSRLQSALLVKGHNYEDIGDKGFLFRDLEKAIVAHHPVSFSYMKAEGLKSYQSVLPYKLVNHKGIWYLAGQDGGKIKSFSITKLSNLLTLETFFVWDSKIDTHLAEDDGIWLSDPKQEVVLKVRAEVAGYFKRRKLIANQVIEKELEDGGLIISAKIGHSNQILPIVRYWIPNIRIISPEYLQVEIDKGLNEYLGRSESANVLVNY